MTETVSIGGIPVRLVDTAGIRDALDEAESIGVRKSLEALADADIVLVVLDASHPPSDDAARRRDTELISSVAQRLAIVVENKIDAIAAAPLVPDGGLPVVMTSAITGQGIDHLRSKILRLGWRRRRQPTRKRLPHQRPPPEAGARLHRRPRRSHCRRSAQNPARDAAAWTSTARCARSTKSPAPRPPTTS